VSKSGGRELHYLRSGSGHLVQELALALPERLLTRTLGASYCGGAGSRLMDPEDFQRLAVAAGSGDRERAVPASWEVNLSRPLRNTGCYPI
jgi:hypothetical protein